MVNSVELATKFSNVVEEIKTTRNNLIKELSSVDLKVSDVQHYIEGRNLNAVEGFKAYKLLQDILRERRVIKNKISEIEPVYYSLIVTNKLDNKAKDIEKKVLTIQNRNSISGYNVKVLKDVFGERIERSL